MKSTQTQTIILLCFGTWFACGCTNNANVAEHAVGRDVNESQREDSTTESSFPVAVDASKVGSYPRLTKSGGGYFYDDVLEYRVWIDSPDGDRYKAFVSYEAALEFAGETDSAEDPLVLVLQKEHINEPEPGVFEHVTTDRITEWRVEWLEEGKRTETSIQEFLQKHGAN